VNKKGISTLVIVAIVIIIVVVAGIAVYVLYMGGGEEEPTPTPTSNPVEGATSISFDVNATYEGELQINKFTAKNLGTSDVLLRVDQTDKDGLEFTYLMNQTGQTAWAKFAGEWTDDSANFDANYWSNPSIGYVALEDHLTALEDWSGTGNYEYTSNGDSFIIYNIAVDPELADSIFEPS
jgi:hypothetical protein